MAGMACSNGYGLGVRRVLCYGHSTAGPISPLGRLTAAEHSRAKEDGFNPRCPADELVT